MYLFAVFANRIVWNAPISHNKTLQTQTEQISLKNPQRRPDLIDIHKSHSSTFGHLFCALPIWRVQVFSVYKIVSNWSLSIRALVASE